MVQDDMGRWDGVSNDRLTVLGSRGGRVAAERWLGEDDDDDEEEEDAILPTYEPTALSTRCRGPTKGSSSRCRATAVSFLPDNDNDNNTQER